MSTLHRPERSATLERIRKRLCANALVFDDPGAYRAGVEDALDAVAQDAAGPLSTDAFTVVQHPSVPKAGIVERPAS